MGNKKNSKIIILNYGIGNLISVKNAIRNIGFTSKISNKKKDLENADLIIIPGVGSFPEAMGELKNLKLINFLKDYAKNKKPLLGICLGMQILCAKSFEISQTNGLGIFPGHVNKLAKYNYHIGWNSIQIDKDSSFSNCDKKEFYFNHSFHYVGSDEHTFAKVRLNNKEKPIVAGIIKDKVIGIQFHPEKSQNTGKELLLLIFKYLLD